jgi:hypothetical protein
MEGVSISFIHHASSKYKEASIAMCLPKLPSCLKILEKGTLLNVITSSLGYHILSTFELGRVQRYTYLFASHLDGTHFLEKLCARSLVCQTYRLCVVVRTFFIKLFVDVSVV